jgi:flagellar protein FliT
VTDVLMTHSSRGRDFAEEAASAALRPYLTMRAISSEMARAARGAQWERVVALEHKVAHLRDTLALTVPVTLTEAERAGKARLIRQILDDDAEVRRHTEPWLEHVRAYLGAARRDSDPARARGQARD